MIHKQQSTQNNIAIDVEMRAITCLTSGVTVNMRPLPFRVLMYLFKNQDKCISRDELFEVCWQGAVVSEQSLTNTISYIRKTIKKLESNELKLKTISKKGYSLVITLNNELPGNCLNGSIVDGAEESSKAQESSKVQELDDSSDDSDKKNNANRELLNDSKRISLPSIRGSYRRGLWLVVNIVFISTLIFLIAKNNMSNASFMDIKNYQRYELDNIDIYISDLDALLVGREFRKDLDGSNLNLCDINKVYIRVYSSPYDNANIAMSAFIITNKGESLNIINYKLVEEELYSSIVESIASDDLCHGSINIPSVF
ncbi:winged helix-turn-helix domain-containing protein [Moritella sp. 36]|uniref:winged helix-turn-helix domain-containing protein n=1 Tax=Moritella sp. 36 TaxID=2746233 RepID=UPI001BAAA082|nr:winged helix-turn-helix domain-containing protein [Moritella sp. 36]QUM91177.1 winged helix-turn-helix domain-containing protein [Moritella sp. 36]